MSEPVAKPVEETSLEELRRRIDRVDDALHDLLIERSEIVLRIGRTKEDNGAPGFFRPAREAAILRRLVERHRGPLPKAALIGVWRQLMGAMLSLQEPLAVCVYADPQVAGLWTLAHDHFSAVARVAAADSAGAALLAVTSGKAAVGVLPLPRADEADPWWPLLLKDGAGRARVAARLPFGPPEVVKGVRAEALAVACVPPRATGKDRSLFVLETAAKVSQGGLAAAVKAVGFDLAFAAAKVEPRAPATWLYLIELEGMVGEDDRRLAALDKLQGEAVRRLWPIGGYAVPFAAAELGIV